MKEQIEEKVIEEIAFDLCLIDRCKHLPKEECNNTTCAHCEAEALYNANYRKQSENMVEVVRCEECQESEVCPDTLLWCNEWDRLVPPKGFCHCGAKTKGGE